MVNARVFPLAIHGGQLDADVSQHAPQAPLRDGIFWKHQDLVDDTVKDPQPASAKSQKQGDVQSQAHLRTDGDRRAEALHDVMKSLTASDIAHTDEVPVVAETVAWESWGRVVFQETAMDQRIPAVWSHISTGNSDCAPVNAKAQLSAPWLADAELPATSPVTELLDRRWSGGPHSRKQREDPGHGRTGLCAASSRWDYANLLCRTRCSPKENPASVKMAARFCEDEFVEVPVVWSSEPGLPEELELPMEPDSHGRCLPGYELSKEPGMLLVGSESLLSDWENRRVKIIRQCPAEETNPEQPASRVKPPKEYETPWLGPPDLDDTVTRVKDDEESCDDKVVRSGLWGTPAFERGWRRIRV